jgi:uncharacterized membrane protein
MSMYNQNDEYATTGWAISKIVGVFLILTGVGVILWTVLQISELFTVQSAFIFLEEMVPAKIALSESQEGLLLPREILVFGIPLWALGTTARIGTMLVNNGLQYMDRPAKKQTPNP